MIRVLQLLTLMLQINSTIILHLLDLNWPVNFKLDHDDNDNVTNDNIVNPGMSDASVNSSPS